MLSILQTAYNYATTYTGTTSLTSSSVLGTINGQSLKYGGSINIEVGSQLTGATTTVLGGIKTKYHKTGNATIVDTSSSTVTNRNYGVETDGTYLAFVNVPWTDTKVTSAVNHYTPATDSNSALSASAANGTAAWGTQVVKGVTVSRDTKGHITGISVQSAAIPAQPTSVTGNAGTATKLATARTLTIGSTGKTFDGSANVNWTLTEIGAAAAGHTHSQYAPIDHTHSNYAPKSHASTATTYGVGTNANYGHLKISDAYTTQTSADTALSLGGAHNLYIAFLNRINALNNEIASLKTKVATLEGYHETKPVTAVTVTPKTYTFYGKGQTVQLTYSIEPTDASNKLVTWMSSDTGIATVNDEGVVTSKAIGTATITAKAEGGLNVKATCVVTVSEATTYYWYAGWKIPTAQNIATIVNDKDPESKSSQKMNPAGKTANSTDGIVMDYNAANIYNTSAKLQYYVVVPKGYGIYDSIGTRLDLDDAAFTIYSSTTIANHTIYRSSNSSRIIIVIIKKIV